MEGFIPIVLGSFVEDPIVPKVPGSFVPGLFCDFEEKVSLFPVCFMTEELLPYLGKAKNCTH